MTQKIVNQKDALQFILGGNALFTCLSLKTQKRYTYKVLIDRKRTDTFKVSVMDGKDNTRDYRQFGEIKIENCMPAFKPISVHTKEKNYCVAFEHILLNLSIGLDMPTLEIWHEGRCCRCGRVLTVPESIENGIGPECAFK